MEGFIAKYDGDGNQIWIISTAGQPEHIISDHLSNIIVTGSFPLGGGNFGNHWEESIGTQTAYLAHYGPDGTLNWVSTAGGSANWNSGYALAVDSNNHIYQTGVVLGGDVWFAGETAWQQEAAGGFLARYDLLGNLIWLNQIGYRSGGSPQIIGYGLALADDQPVLIGRFRKSVGIGSIFLQNSIGPDMIIVEYDTDGIPTAAGHFIGDHVTGGKSICMGNGEIYVAGYATSTDDPGAEINAVIAKISGLTDITVGADQTFSPSFTAYPNPATESISIEFPDDLQGLKQVSLFTAEGKLLGSWAIREQYGRIPIKYKGQLLIRVQAENKLWAQKIVAH